MDIVLDLLKAGLTLGFVVFVLLAVATLFIVIFRFAIDLDNRVSRE